MFVAPCEARGKWYEGTNKKIENEFIYYEILTGLIKENKFYSLLFF
jgi:hypothetical protein